jgi:CRP-like cAMP-binding protein
MENKKENIESKENKENKAKMQQFKEETVILREGELNKEMYKIISGKVAVYINYGKENECLVGILSEQKCFGELGLLCKTPSMYTLVAVYDVLIRRIPEEEFVEFLRNNFYNGINIMESLAKEVKILKCNLDMVMEEMEKSSEIETYKVNQLKERVYKNFASNTEDTIFDKE